MVHLKGPFSEHNAVETFYACMEGMSDYES